MTYLKRLLGINGKDPAVEEERKKLKEAIKNNDKAGDTVQRKLQHLVESAQKSRHITER